MALGIKIRTLREERNLSQKELATLIGVTIGTVAEWEADESSPNLIELSRLSKALNVSSDVLLDATADVTPAPVATPKQAHSLFIEPPRKRKKKGWIIVVALLAIAIIATLWVGGFLNGVTLPTWPTVVPTEPLAFSENTSAIETADSSVVTIFCYDFDGELVATGSGFVAFDSKTIITNYHVMTSAYSCKISTNQDISYAVSKILCYSKEQDIAILQLVKDTGLQPLTLGDSSLIKKGEAVVAIGSPLGIKNTVSTGVLSGRLMEDNMDVLQFTAPISSGSSGGALFDDNGNVIGITYASYVDGQNLNLAIPIELAASLYQSKNVTKKVSTIYLDENPHIAYLEQNNIPEVTLIDLKINPEKYDNSIVKLTTYVSSFYPDPDGEWEFSYLFVSEKADITNNVDYDFDLSYNSDLDFQECPNTRCSLIDCVTTNENLQAGQKITIIGQFDYTAKGTATGWGDSEITQNLGSIYAKYLYF